MREADHVFPELLALGEDFFALPQRPSRA